MGMVVLIVATAIVLAFLIYYVTGEPIVATVSAALAAGIALYQRRQV